MAMVKDYFVPLRPCMRRLGASSLALAVALSSAEPAWAQRRRAEPEANPAFQQQVQSSPDSGGGGPISAPAAAPSADEAAPAPARNVESVQIGAAPAPKPEEPKGPVNPLDTRVTVRVKGAPLATFLDTISAQARVNFIITEGLESRRITAFLQNVTVREALQVLLEYKGLTYQRIGKSNTYLVTPRSKARENYITRIYTLSYVPLIPVGNASADVQAITPNASSTLGATGGGGPSNGPPSASAPAAGSEVSIISVIQSVLSKGGHVTVEPRTNSLIITDVPEVFPQIEQIIAELDKKAPQVMIEAQIVEIDSTRARDLGFEWGGPNGELATFTGGARDTTFPLNLPSNVANARFFDPITNLVSAIGAGGAGGSGGSTTGAPLIGSTLRTSVLDLTQLRVTLRALVSRSEARFLGKPKILTLNNKSAVIQIASNQAVSATQASSGGSGGPQLTGITIERIQTGLVLKVTPQINKDGYITMLVQPTFTDVQEAAVSTTANRVFDPISRGASSLVRVKNGQTLVMGGLLESTETKVTRKVPLLGYIPIIGWLFTSQSATRRNSDLVIFLTPTIVSD